MTRRSARLRTALRGVGQRLRARVRGGLGGDSGSALVEFLGVALILLVPVVYLVLVLGRIQAATFAAEGAAREAARVYVAAPDADTGAGRAVTAVGVALRDQGFTDAPADALALTCSASACLAAGEQVTAAVEVRVPLPFVPAFVRDVVPLEVPVRVERTADVDAYRVVGR
ncbi:pilus assembly protein [Cellulomonas telluris]|uniref:pilus assembly protein n=1 Tax=Cellulomonas telluris TaxID=2306636 RepID=UPI0027961201|nr:pilus assembly protein [Cellulomonas telluris]